MEAEAEFEGETPAEFVDSIMSSMMLDPVRLPSSRQVIDRRFVRGKGGGGVGGESAGLCRD